MREQVTRDQYLNLVRLKVDEVPLCVWLAKKNAGVSTPNPSWRCAMPTKHESDLRNLNRRSMYSILAPLVLLAAVAGAGCSTAAPPAGTATFADDESATLKRMSDEDLFAGSVLVARNGKVLLQGGFGLADRALRTANTPTTRFHIGSISKQFTAMAILMLEKRNRLHVSDPVCAHLPACPQAWGQVTIQQLLNHTAGIENYPYDQIDLPDRFRQPVTPAEQVAQAGERPLVSQPGTEWRYCNVCYAALGLVVEKESGTTLTQFLKNTDLRPAGYARYRHRPGAAHTACGTGLHATRQHWTRLPAGPLVGLRCRSDVLDCR